LILERRPADVYTYTKQAAELGLVEAQHNLGSLYLEGAEADAQKPSEKCVDEVKALSWYSVCLHKVFEGGLQWLSRVTVQRLPNFDQRN
jgi:hypothetical protein